MGIPIRKAEDLIHKAKGDLEKAIDLYLKDCEETKTHEQSLQVSKPAKKKKSKDEKLVEMIGVAFYGMGKLLVEAGKMIQDSSEDDN